MVQSITALETKIGMATTQRLIMRVPMLMDDQTRRQTDDPSGYAKPQRWMLLLSPGMASSYAYLHCLNIAQGCDGISELLLRQGLSLRLGIMQQELSIIRHIIQPLGLPSEAQGRE